MKDMREEFEAHCREKLGMDDRDLERDGNYTWLEQRRMWSCWQAAWSRRSASTEVSEDTKNLARYQWLRSDDIEVQSGQREIYVVMDRLPHTEEPQKVLTESELDAVIDAARAGSGETK